MKQYKNHFLVILAIYISDLFNYGNISICDCEWLR